MRFLRFMLATLALLALTAYPVGAAVHRHETAPTVTASSHDHTHHHGHRDGVHVSHEVPCSNHHDHKKCCGMACCASSCTPLEMTAQLIERAFQTNATMQAPNDLRQDGVPAGLPQRPPRTI